MTRQNRPGVEILVYKGKNGDAYWLIDTPARRDAAMKAIFEQLDEYHCYDDDNEQDVASARAGNSHAIRGLLDRHQGYEYEDWDIEFAEIAE